MTITFTVALFQYRIGTINITITTDQESGVAHPLDRGVKNVSRWWTRRMAS